MAIKLENKDVILDVVADFKPERNSFEFEPKINLQSDKIEIRLDRILPFKLNSETVLLNLYSSSVSSP